ncbi:AF4/FMR2 family member lilli isoform X2 [Folsomia candida]|uniref:AF4/FMR2 family member lilli isoform X2 n=1 Tax=Folsomia candida TaxID=158441 RepID=UPI000B8F7327|nr:AF4/FMR2 family member lilli isoform X2 [Folsomia candida]
MIMHSSPFNMRQYNLSVMKPPVSKSAVQTTSSSSNSNNNTNKSTYTNAANSLDLLRQNIQRNINHDIQEVITKYLNIFFKQGIENIRNNLGPDSVTDDHISNMCRQILDEAKHMYPLNPMALGSGKILVETSMPTLNHHHHHHHHDNADQKLFSAPIVPQQQQPLLQQQVMINNQINQQLPNVPDTKLPLTSPSSFGIKRESDTDSEASCMSNASKKVKKSSSSKVNNGNSSATGGGGGGNKKSNNNNSSDNSTSPQKPKKPSGPSRKHVVLWDSSRLTIDTMFIMGAKANKALGFAQTRGRLYVKHPGLFKYASDSDDKEWLSKNKLMPATGGRAYIMLLEDIEKLAKDNTLNVTINYEDILGFKVPDFILEKMKNYIANWKKTYAEEDEKSAAAHRNRPNKSTPSSSSSSSSSSNLTVPPPPAPPTSQAAHLTPLNSSSVPHSNHLLNNNVIANNSMTPNVNAAPNNPPTPSLLPDMQQQYQKQQQQHHQNHVVPQPSLNNFITGNASTNVLYESFSAPQAHEIPEYMHIDKPPPMYPGQPPPQQQQQHQTMQTMSTPGGGNYTIHSNQLDPIEQAISKGDWSQVSDRSLLQYALQSTRSIGSWDPQDSFDLIESVTNGGLVSLGGVGGSGPGVGTGNGGVGDTTSSSISSPLMQISSPTGGGGGGGGGHPPLGPNCELSAVLDQVSAFQYTET